MKRLQINCVQGSQRETRHSCKEERRLFRRTQHVLINRNLARTKMLSKNAKLAKPGYRICSQLLRDAENLKNKW